MRRVMEPEKKKTKTKGKAKGGKPTYGFRLSSKVYKALVDLANQKYGGNKTMALEMTLVESFGLNAPHQ